jgi:hypothetical protein
VRFESPEAFPVNIFEFKIPPTVRLVRTPTDVMLGWDACETTKARSAHATLPTRFAEFREEIEEPFVVTFVTVAVPRTYKLDPLGGLLNVPIDTPF